MPRGGSDLYIPTLCDTFDPRLEPHEIRDLLIQVKECPGRSLHVGDRGHGA